jgi:hypothetical protein
VLISNLVVRKKRTAPALQGTSVFCGSQGAAEIRPIFVDLDRTPARVRVGSGRRPFGFTLARGETETFDIEAQTTKSYVRWTLELDLIVGGHKQAIQVDDEGRPFETTALSRNASWSWFEDRWNGPSGQVVPAGQPLPVPSK